MEKHIVTAFLLTVVSGTAFTARRYVSVCVCLCVSVTLRYCIKYG